MLDKNINFSKQVKSFWLRANTLIKLRSQLVWRFNQIASLPSQIVEIISKLAVIEKNILYPQYQKYIQQHENQLPTLNPTDAAIVEEIRKNGVYVSSLEALKIPETEIFISQAQAICQDLAVMATQPHHSKDYKLLATSAQLLQYKKVLEWGLNEKLLNIVENYLHLPVGYDGLLFVRSQADGREVGERIWHRDREDRRMLKICVYLNDVDAENGPLEYLKPTFNELICNHVQGQYKSLFHQEIKGLLSSALEDEWSRTFIGCAGTVIFIDTAQYYHRGKPPTRRERNAIFFSYFSRRPWHPFFCGRSFLSREVFDDLTLKASAKTRACVNWHDQLPWLIKWIPVNRI